MADENRGTSPFCLLPEDCIAKIVSFTSPKDACKAAAVSPVFKSVVEFDTVWERFLPPDYKEIISMSCSSVNFSTMKELYILLSESLLLDEGEMSFRLSRSTGKKCYMLCARELDIAWKDNLMYRKWNSLPESRFGEVANLHKVYWLEISGRFQVKMLSPNTNYAAYRVFKFSKPHCELDCSSKASVKFLNDGANEIGREVVNIVYIDPLAEEIVMECNIDARVPCRRLDGWLELELGEFLVAEGDNRDVEAKLSETEILYRKGGLIVEGIEVRPKES